MVSGVTDIIIIGSGIAGLSFALKASKFADVTLITKDKIDESNTKYAQGGLAAVFGKDDSYELHIKDTLRAGDGLCNKDVVEFFVKNAPKEILWLKTIGVKFDKPLSKEAVHSKARIVHAGDITGERVEDILVNNAIKNKRIKILEHHQAINLTVKNNICYGAKVLGVKNNRIIDIRSKAVVLATGGLGRLYKNTCNPEIATGDGFALAYKAGADLQDMEFVQFHPTGLYGSKPIFLISETLRGEGGILKNIHMQPFMKNYHRDGDLAPRDVVSKFSVIEMKKTNSKFVYLDMSHLDSSYLKNRFPNIYRKCLEYGIDLTKEPIPVSPTAHYSCGGVKIDFNARTTINGLYAIGEVSCSGLHGADRLASNSLPDGLVFGSRLCDYLRKNIKGIKTSREIINDRESNKKNINKNKLNKIKRKLQNLMWEKVGIIRDEKGLKEALKVIVKVEKEISTTGTISKEIIELKNMAAVSKIIVLSALRRKESRGTHFIEDYPESDDAHWLKHLSINRELAEPLIQRFLNNF